MKRVKKKSKLIKIVPDKKAKVVSKPKLEKPKKEKKPKPLTAAQQIRLAKRESRERKKAEKLEKKAERELKKKRREEKRLAKLTAEPKVRVRLDIEAAQRDWEEVYKLGLVKKREGSRFDMTGIKQSYFSSLPEHLVVTTETETNKFLWCAQDFVRQQKKEVLILKEHRPPSEYDLQGFLIAVDGANREKIFLYDQVCIMPQNYREKVIKHVQAVNRLTDKKSRKNVNIQAVLNKEEADYFNEDEE